MALISVAEKIASSINVMFGLMNWNQKLTKLYKIIDIILIFDGERQPPEESFCKKKKRVVRIVERGVTRVSEPNVSLSEAFLIKLF
jgi:hypothetical protein